MRTRRAALGLLAPLLLPLACASGGGGTGARATRVRFEFPSESQLERIASKPVPDRGRTRAVRQVGEWTLSGPLPTRTGSLLASDDGLRGRLLRDVETGGSGALVTVAMQCYAREYGRFLLAHGAEPAPSLRRFISARCGAVAPPSVQFTVQPLQPDQAPETIAAAQREWYGEHLATTPLGERTEVGMWIGKDSHRALVVSASGRRALDIVATDMAIGGNVFVVQGRKGPGIDLVMGHANRGSFGFSRCRTMPSAAGSFSLECPLDASDDQTYVEIAASEKGRVLASRQATILVAPGGSSLGNTWRGPAGAGAGTPEPLALLRQTNQLRQSLGMQPLADAPRQRAQSDALIPWYAAATSGAADPEIADQVVLGLLAGYAVDGIIRDADFVSDAMYGSGPEALAYLLESPGARSTLLEPAAEKAAISVQSQGHSSLATFTTYQFFSERTDYDRAERILLDRLDQVRVYRGKDRVIRVGDSGQTEAALSQAVARIKAGTPPGKAMSAALDEIVHKLGVTLRAQVMSTNDLESVEFPRILLQLDHPVIALKVGHYQSPGQPWGEYVVIMFIGDDDQM